MRFSTRYPLPTGAHNPDSGVLCIDNRIPSTTDAITTDRRKARRLRSRRGFGKNNGLDDGVKQYQEWIRYQVWQLQAYYRRSAGDKKTAGKKIYACWLDE
jgi:hypothetical protein